MMEANQPCKNQERVFHKDPVKRSMENLSAMPDKTNVSYSTSVGSHYDSEGLEMFPESGHEEAGRWKGKDIREEMEARGSTVELQPWRPDGTKEAWGAVEDTVENWRARAPSTRSSCGSLHFPK